MKVIGLKATNLTECVKDAQRERIVITRNGKPVALVVGVAGLDAEQLELSSSSEFWGLITTRRQEAMLTRKQLEQRIGSTAVPHISKAARHGVAAASSKKRPPRRG